MLFKHRTASTPTPANSVHLFWTGIRLVLFIGSEPLVLLWLSSQRYRFLYRQANMALSSRPSWPSRPAQPQMYTFGLGLCLGLGLGLEALSSWLRLAQSNQH